VHVSNQISLLAADTAYRYRFVTKNSASPTAVVSAAFTVVTRPVPDGTLLPDGRGWEMVSPVDKNGGNVSSTMSLHAAPNGEALSFGSTASFAGSPASPLGGVYIARRGSNWATEAVDPPQFNHSGP
jgi:hypothetical protein